MTINTCTRIAAVLAASIGLSAFAADQKLTAPEVEKGKQYLEQTRNYVIGATKGLSETQWKFKTAPDRWSIAEILEHMVVTQEFVLGPVRAELAKSGAKAVDTKQVDAAIVNLFPDRSTKFKAPDFLVPTGRWTPAEALERFNKNYDALIEYLTSTPDLREHVVGAVPLKALTKGAYDSMDGYEWVLASGGHTERHTLQMLEVRADPHFPAK